MKYNRASKEYHPATLQRFDKAEKKAEKKERLLKQCDRMLLKHPDFNFIKILKKKLGG